VRGIIAGTRTELRRFPDDSDPGWPHADNMSDLPRSACVAIAVAGVIAAASADDSAESGRQIFDRRCRTCHGGTGPADSPLGPNLAGVVGRKAGTTAGGVHSRAPIDSGIVWNRESLRRFLSVPRSVLPDSIMPVGVAEPAELEPLLDYLESFR
jgi:cytochrome c